MGDCNDIECISYRMRPAKCFHFGFYYKISYNQRELSNSRLLLHSCTPDLPIKFISVNPRQFSHERIFFISICLSFLNIFYLLSSTVQQKCGINIIGHKMVLSNLQYKSLKNPEIWVIGLCYVQHGFSTSALLTFGAGNSLLHVTVLCTVGCLAASLAFTY